MYPEFKERFQSSRDSSNNSFILTITNVQPSDSGVYYCSVWGRVYGRGSQLIVDIWKLDSELVAHGSECITGPVLLQSPSLGHVTKGHAARLQCTMQNAAVTRTDVHWYWKQPGNVMKHIITHEMKNNIRRRPGFTDRFQPSRDPSSNSFILTITNVQPRDTGVYYCSVWGRIYGRGSLLNIT
eukprot:g35260.t1